MAITINVGGSKKVSKNYDSQGVSLNVTAEVPNDALSDPQKIADTAGDLFTLVHSLLDEQIANLSQTDAKPGNGTIHRGNGRSQSNGASGNGHSRGRYQGNGRSNGNGRSAGGSGGASGASRDGSGGRNPDRPLTQAQQRAINTMVKRLNEDGDEWVHHEFGVGNVGSLSVRQASEFIDILKSVIEDQQPANA